MKNLKFAVTINNVKLAGNNPMLHYLSLNHTDKPQTQLNGKNFKHCGTHILKKKKRMLTSVNSNH